MGVAPLDPQLLDDIVDAAPDLNPGDNMSPRVLRAIARHAAARPVLRSAETGAGGSTLLFSQISEKHTAFAIEGDNRIITRVRASGFFRSVTTEIVEGPTQATLPGYRFDRPLQAVLIDGPHGFPFPQLEYFYLYPHIAANGLLILDDIHIRTIHELHRFLSRDDMFDLLEVVDRTAFYRRTSAPVFDPLGDGWWLQAYNRKRLARYLWRESLAQALPHRVRRWIGRKKPEYPVSIDAPQANSVVGPSAVVCGTAALPAGCRLWLFARRADAGGWWPQGGGPADFTGDRWRQECKFGEAIDAGFAFEIAAVVVDQQGHMRLLRRIAERERSGADGPMSLPAPPAAIVTVKRGSNG